MSETFPTIRISQLTEETSSSMSSDPRKTWFVMVNAESMKTKRVSLDSLLRYLAQLFNSAPNFFVIEGRGGLTIDSLSSRTVFLGNTITISDNTTLSIARTSGNTANLAFLQANGAFTKANQAYNSIELIHNKANSAYLTANLAYNVANTANSMQIKLATIETGANVNKVLSVFGREGNVNLFSSDVVQALGFTPVTQGGVSGMSSSKVIVGWRTDGVSLGLQIDGTPFGNNWPINITGNAVTSTQSLFSNSSSFSTESKYLAWANPDGFPHKIRIGWNGNGAVLKIDGNDNANTISGGGTYFGNTWPINITGRSSLSTLADSSNSSSFSTESKYLAWANPDGFPHKIRIGWNGAKAVLKIDGDDNASSVFGTYFGGTWPIDISGRAAIATTADNATNATKSNETFFIRYPDAFGFNHWSYQAYNPADGKYYLGINNSSSVVRPLQSQWPIDISGRAAIATTADNATNANYAQTALGQVWPGLFGENHTVYVGWYGAGGKLVTQVDNTWFGTQWPIDISGNSSRSNYSDQTGFGGAYNWTGNAGGFFTETAHWYTLTVPGLGNVVTVFGRAPIPVGTNIIVGLPFQIILMSVSATFKSIGQSGVTIHTEFNRGSYQGSFGIDSYGGSGIHNCTWIAIGFI